MLVQKQRVVGFRPIRCCSGGATGHRHAAAGHDVDDLAGDPGLGLPDGQSPGVEAAAVINRPLPAKPTALLDHLDVPVALCRRNTEIAIVVRILNHRLDLGRPDSVHVA
jgi:hypothetical protein